MLKRLISIAGFFTGGGWVPLAVAAGAAFLLGAGVAGGGVWWVQSARIDGYQLQVAAADKALQVVTANRDALSRDNDRLAGVVERQQREADAIQAKAEAAIKAQQAAASKIRVELRDAKDRTATLLQQIQDAHHAQPIVVSEIVIDDFDPLIRFGLERLRCEQRAGNRGEGPDRCRVPLPAAEGGAGAAGAAGGAGDYRPGFDTQVRMLNDLWRLHEWGASCYADKAAIAESEQSAIEGAQP